MFEKHTNIFMCKAPGKEMLQEARETGSWHKSPKVRGFPSLEQDLMIFIPFIWYPNFCYLQTPNQWKYEEILSKALIKNFYSVVT